MAVGQALAQALWAQALSAHAAAVGPGAGAGAGPGGGAVGPIGPVTPTCVWRASAALVLALDNRFGEPVDAYVNGSQVWLRPDGPNGIVIEWRLHPIAGYVRPRGVETNELFAQVAYALASGEDPPAPLEELWDGLEAFPAYADDVEPSPLAAAATEALGIAPDAAGLVDHPQIGDAWERSRGGISIITEVLRQLQP